MAAKAGLTPMTELHDARVYALDAPKLGDAFEDLLETSPLDGSAARSVLGRSERLAPR